MPRMMLEEFKGEVNRLVDNRDEDGTIHWFRIPRMFQSLHSDDASVARDWVANKIKVAVIALDLPKSRAWVMVADAIKVGQS